MGRNSILELLRAKPHHLDRIYTTKNLTPDNRNREIEALIDGNQVPVEYVTSDYLTDLVDGSESHQSFVGVLKENSILDLKDIIEELAACESGLVVILDEIVDPQNLGSILRASECFGAKAVIWSRNKGASLTPVARKVSVGASELVPTVEVGNISTAIQKLKDAQYWIVGAEVAKDAKNIFTFEMPKKVALVLGSEEAGLHALVKENLDFKVYIPMSGQLDSLNVSQATAVFLATYRARNAT